MFCGYLFYTLNYNPILLLDFASHIFPVVTIGNPLNLVLCPLEIMLLFFFNSTFLLSSHSRCSRLILCIYCLCPRISHFPKEPWFLLIENGIRNQDLSPWCAS